VAPWSAAADGDCDGGDRAVAGVDDVDGGGGGGDDDDDDDDDVADDVVVEDEEGAAAGGGAWSDRSESDAGEDILKGGRGDHTRAGNTETLDGSGRVACGGLLRSCTPSTEGRGGTTLARRPATLASPSPNKQPSLTTVVLSITSWRT
jgi:hypothetical protein